VAADRQQWLCRFSGDAPPQTIDPYGRTVAEMFRNGRNVNLAIESSGYAYRKYLGACDGSAFLGAEAAAQRQRVGVWTVPGGIQRPWDWRKGTRSPAASTAALFLPAVLPRRIRRPVLV
jgi:endonuclease YncB( thermonuclease family)